MLQVIIRVQLDFLHRTFLHWRMPSLWNALSHPSGGARKRVPRRRTRRPWDCTLQAIRSERERKRSAWDRRRRLCALVLLGASSRSL